MRSALLCTLHHLSCNYLDARALETRGNARRGKGARKDKSDSRDAGKRWAQGFARRGARRGNSQGVLCFVVAGVALALLAGCGGAAREAAGAETPIANLQPAALEGRLPRVVATTNLVGDVVQQVAGDRVELTVLLPAGSDPHAFVASPQDMVALANADLVIANGLGLEEALLPTLLELSGVPVVSVNEGVTTLAPAAEAEEAEEHADEEHEHTGVDPHTWQNVQNVAIWAANVGHALGAIDPTHATEYAAAADVYATELQALDAELRAALAAVPPANRKLVTDHDTFAYFADAYDFTVIGSVVGSFSSLASLSARGMARLQEQIGAEGARALFVGNSTNPALAEQVARDVRLPVVRLFTDSLAAPGNPGDSYIEMMRANVAAIVAALR